MKAVWNGATIAESDATLLVEGNHYFPEHAVEHNYLRPSAMKSVCPWKGLAESGRLSVSAEARRTRRTDFERE